MTTEQYTARGLSITIWIFLAVGAGTTLTLGILAVILEGVDGYLTLFGPYSWSLTVTGVFCALALGASGIWCRPGVKPVVIVGLVFLLIFSAQRMHGSVTFYTDYPYSPDWTWWHYIGVVAVIPAFIMHLIVIIVACVSRPKNNHPQAIYPASQTAQPMPQQFSPQSTIQTWN